MYRMMLRLIVPVAVALAGTGSPSARAEDDASVCAGRGGDRIAACSRLIKRAPGAGAYVNRAMAHAYEHHFDQALADADAALRLDANSASACRARGEIYYIRATVTGNAGDYGLAVAEYGKALRMTPNDAAIHLQRAQVYQAMGDGDRMIADYGDAVRLDPDNADVYWKRGLALSLVKEDDEHAIADFARVIKLRPDDAAAFESRGAAYDRSGDHDRAIADFGEAIRIRPKDAFAYEKRGRAYAHKADYDHAIADFDRALSLDPDLDAYLIRGGAHFVKGDYDRAIADCDAAIKIDLDARAYYLRGLVYEARGDARAAIADFGEVLALNPSWVEVRERRERLAGRATTGAAVAVKPAASNKAAR